MRRQQSIQTTIASWKATTLVVVGMVFWFPILLPCLAGMVASSSILVEAFTLEAPSLSCFPRSQRRQQQQPRVTSSAKRMDTDHDDQQADKPTNTTTTTSSVAAAASSSWKIRSCQYNELGQVAEIMMDSFYQQKSAWKKLYYLAELNRLQNNFPYADQDLHQMKVVVVPLDGDNADTQKEAAAEKVVGFVDIDARPCKTQIVLPRPYLSDLCIHPNYRRQGMAKALVESCEAFVRQMPKDYLWIRVQESNDAALAMYQTLGYDITVWPQENTNKNTQNNDEVILTLRKRFAET